MRGFPWAARAAAVEEARLALKARPMAPDAAERFHAALDAAYPEHFWPDYERLKAGDPDGVEVAIAFLEADPWLFRSGYIKARIAHALKRVPLSKDEVKRLEKVLLAIVDDRNTDEFRAYSRLARATATPALIAALTERLTAEDTRVQLRAGWMLACIGQKPTRREG